MFICTECGKKFKNDQSAINNWCLTCHNIESQRSIAQDTIPGNKFIRTRPAKFMLQPSDYKMFGY